MRFPPRVKWPLSMRKLLWVVTRCTRSKISFQGNFTSALKTGAKFHSGANSLCFQYVTATNFWPSLILWPMLWLMQKILSHNHYFVCLNNWNNVQVASFRIFFFFKFTLEKNKNWKKKKIKQKNLSYEKMRH